MNQANGGQSETLTVRDVRSALKLWHNVAQLGAHRLAQLRLVEVKRVTGNYAPDPVGLGLALRHLLEETLACLKPDGSEPVFHQTAWQPYLILWQQYVKGRHREWLTEQMAISNRTYHRLQKEALQKLAALLAQWEQEKVTTPVPYLMPALPPHELVGRQELIQKVKEKLIAGKTVCLHGLPGVGKTSLALSLAHDADILHHFRDGILWAGLGRQPDLQATQTMWAEAIGLEPTAMRGQSDLGKRGQSIQRHIGLRRMLLVADDVWQVEAVQSLRVGGPHCACLITTRHMNIALDTPGDQVILVTELSAADGLQLLRALAPELDDSYQEPLAALAQATGGLPLALFLMGRYLRQHSYTRQPRRIAQALTDLQNVTWRLQVAQPQMPASPHPSLPPTDDISLTSIIDLSFRALDPRSRQAKLDLSTFPPKPNSFSEEAALAVTASSPQTLDALVDSGLLETYSQGRYTLHQTIADYARARQVDTTAARRLVEYFAGYVEMHEEDYLQLDQERENVMAALQMAAALPLPVTLIHLVSNFFTFLELRGLYEPAETYLELAVAAAQEPAYRSQLGYLLGCQGRLMYLKGKTNEAIRLLEAGISLLENSGQNALVVQLLIWSGMVHHRNQVSLAVDCLAEALERSREIGDRQLEGRSLHILGISFTLLGQPQKGLACLEQSLPMARSLNDKRLEQTTLLNLASCYQYLGQMSDAVAALAEGLHISRQLGHQRNEGYALMMAGLTYRYLAQFDKAIDYLMQALAVYRRSGLHSSDASILGQLGRVYRDTNQYEKALDCLRQAVALSCAADARRAESHWLAYLGTVYHRQGNIEQARTQYQQAWDMSRELGDRRYQGIWQGRLGTAHRDLGDFDKGLALLQEALVISRECHDLMEEGRWLGEMGRSYWMMGQPDLARAYLQQSRQVLGKTEAYVIMQQTWNWADELERPSV